MSSTLDDIANEYRKRYAYPLQDIQDQIGARVIVFYKSDMENVKKHVLSEFRIYEQIAKEPEKPDQFGYEAEHIVCFLPPDIIETHSLEIDFFELQICTMFQHAWAEANHDLGYKPGGEVSNDITRKLAWAAAQAYGADTIFNDIWKSLNSNHNEDLQKN